MNFNQIMIISIDQCLEVFLDSFHSLYFFGGSRIRINVIGVKILFLVYFIKLMSSRLQTGQTDLINTNHFKTDIRQIFKHL